MGLIRIRDSIRRLFFFTQSLVRKILSLPLVAWVYQHRQLLLLRHELVEGLNGVPSLDVHANEWGDLSLFEQTERWLSKEQFLEEAERRNKEGMRFYSVIRCGKLVYYSWVVPNQSSARFPAVDQSFEFPDGADVIFNAYTHPEARGQGIHKQVLMRQLYDSSQQQGTSSVFIAIDPKNLPARLAVEAAGFEPVALFWKKTCFGRSTKGASSLTRF